MLGDDIGWPLRLSVRFSSDEGCLFTGYGTTFNGTSIILEGSGRSVVLGDDCMFSWETAVRTSDLHAILDGQGNCINPSADVVTGLHVRVGEGVSILKGVEIGSGAVLAARALVTRSVEANTIVAGVPAKLLRESVAWDRRRPKVR